MDRRAQGGSSRSGGTLLSDAVNVVRLQASPQPTRLAAAPTVLAQGLSYTFDAATAPKQVLFDIDISVEPGEFVILTGPSGAGKTTLLTLVGALRTPQTGSLRVFGKELVGLSSDGQREIRRRTGFIFQDHNLFEALTAAQTLALALQVGGERLEREAMRVRAMELLTAMGMGMHIDAKPGVLSIGQKQRIAIARALINNPALVLADEPTAALDADNARLVIDLLRRRADTEGVSILMVTHDDRAFPAANRIVEFVDGRMKPT